MALIKQPFQVGIDVWEGNYLDVNGEIEMDVPVFLSNRVSYMIARINDMYGGHHNDEYFPQLWKIAEQFRRRAIYFVYNPWVTGESNFNWLANKLPLGYNGRIFSDIEVKYGGYSPVTYYQEVMKYLNLLIARWTRVSIYTGEWFLSTLSAWPNNFDYWWGSYPNLLVGCPSWSEYYKRIITLPFGSFNASKCPGPIGLAQMSGDGYKPEGAHGYAVDTNIFLGTETECDEYFGVTGPTPPTPVDPKQAMYDELFKINASSQTLQNLIRTA